MNSSSDDHWLTRPATIRRLWIVFALILAATVALQFVIPVPGKFVLDNSFGFGAWFGFVSCVAMVLVARVLGWWLKRPEDYYEQPPADDAEAAGNRTAGQEPHDA